MTIDTAVEIEEIKDLAGSDGLLNKIDTEAALEVYFSALSKYTEDHPGLNQKFKPVRFEENGDGSIKIFNTNGLELNSILPRNIRFINVHSPKLKPNFLEDVPLLPENFNRGIIGVAIIAHEIGEALDPNTLSDYYEANELSQRRYGDKPLSEKEKVDLILGEMTVILKAERSAWDYGKSVADFFGIDEILYEDLMNTAMATYYFYYFSEMLPYQLTLLNKDEISPTTKFNIYSLTLQDIQEVEFKDLYKVSLEAKEKKLLNKSRKTFETITGISLTRFQRYG